MKKVAFYTLGCKVNQYETEAMLEMFKKEGYTQVDSEDAGVRGKYGSKIEIRYNGPDLCV